MLRSIPLCDRVGKDILNSQDIIQHFHRDRAQCCSRNCMYNLIEEYKNNLVDLQSLNICQSIMRERNQSPLSNFDAFVSEIRALYVDYHTTDSNSVNSKLIKEDLSQKLVCMLNENKLYTASESRFYWIYSITTVSRSRMIFCKSAFEVLTGVSESIIESVQRKIRDSKTSMIKENIVPVTMEDAMRHFNLDYLTYQYNIEAFMRREYTYILLDILGT